MTDETRVDVSELRVMLRRVGKAALTAPQYSHIVTNLLDQNEAQAARIDKMRVALREIALETHETIPRDGKDAIYAALMRVAGIALAAIKEPAL